MSRCGAVFSVAVAPAPGVSETPVEFVTAKIMSALVVLLSTPAAIKVLVTLFPALVHPAKT